MSEPTSQHSVEQFHHCLDTGDGSGCSCPIHRDREREPFTAPLGLSFADRVSAEPITRQQAATIYDAHHAYMDSLPSVNLAHHGLYYQNELMGAITYRYPLLSKKRLHFGPDGEVLPEPITDSDIERLPPELRATSRRIIPTVSAADVATTEVVSGETIVEAARICLGVRMANLASATLARSQERFVQSKACEDDVRYLLTFLRADYEGAMIRALRDKGWICTGWTKPSQAGNRDQKPIREHYKWRFLCPIEPTDSQSTFNRWSP
ncbi:hypothetical protein [Saliphagus sp. LR7]|uniref:hypothetical protein n=1 Tax=Saliphagus sp. LR7 TaxID=2282654 RepID=UPI000DF75A7C|nr:hypothetical protein [Saliphagus sp. LR7]